MEAEKKNPKWKKEKIYDNNNQKQETRTNWRRGTGSEDWRRSNTSRHVPHQQYCMGLKHGGNIKMWDATNRENTKSITQVISNNTFYWNANGDRYMVSRGEKLNYIYKNYTKKVEINKQQSWNK